MRAYIDLETGGLDPNRNQIFSIGLIIGGEEHLIRVAYDPRKPVHPGALRVNGIDPDRWEGYPLDMALRIVREHIDEHRLVAHNAAFDASFLNAACAQSRIALAVPWSCTLDWSRRIPELRSLSSKSLASLYMHLFGELPRGHHDALEDARSCSRIAQALGTLDPDERYLRVFLDDSDVSRHR